MTTLNDLFPSKWLKASDMPEDGDLVVTITKINQEELGRDDKKEIKPILHFQEIDKGLVLNQTNGKAIAGIYGPQVEDWIGKRVALFATEVEAYGEMTLAIRVRLKAPAHDGATTGGTPAGSAGATPAQIWSSFMRQSGASLLDVQAALGVEKVSEWLAADPARTLNDAMGLVQQKISENF